MIVLIKKLLFSKPKPLYHKGIKINEFSRFFAGLMCNGQNGACIHITHENSGKIIQFTKQIDETKEKLIFTYANDQSEKETCENIINNFNNNGIAYQATKADAGAGGNFSKYISVYNIDSIENAVEITKHTLNAMGIDSEDSFTIHFDGPIIFSPKTIKANLIKYKNYL